MRVRLGTLMAGPQGVHYPGAVIEVSSEVGRVLLRQGATVEEDAESRMTETATLDPQGIAETDRQNRKKRRGNKWLILKNSQ